MLLQKLLGMAMAKNYKLGYSPIERKEKGGKKGWGEFALVVGGMSDLPNSAKRNLQNSLILNCILTFTLN